jgi:hypothetical protein
MRHHSIVYPLAVGLVYLCHGGHIVAFNAASTKIFGMANGGFICSLILTASPLTQTASSLLYKFSGGNAQLVLQVGTAMVFINLALLLFFDDSEMQITKEGREIPTGNNIFNKILRRNKPTKKESQIELDGLTKRAL